MKTRERIYVWRFEVSGTKPARETVYVAAGTHGTAMVALVALGFKALDILQTERLWELHALAVADDSEPHVFGSKWG